MVGGEGLWNDVYPGVRWPNPGIIKLIFVFIALEKSKGSDECPLVDGLERKHLWAFIFI